MGLALAEPAEAGCVCGGARVAAGLRRHTRTSTARCYGTATLRCACVRGACLTSGSATPSRGIPLGPLHRGGFRVRARVRVRVRVRVSLLQREAEQHGREPEAQRVALTAREHTERAR